jgi:hypothetical protein
MTSDEIVSAFADALFALQAPDEAEEPEADE